MKIKLLVAVCLALGPGQNLSQVQADFLNNLHRWMLGFDHPDYLEYYASKKAA